MDPQVAIQHRAQVEEFRRRHRTGLLTLLFTDLVGSTRLKQVLGDREGVALIQSHHALVRELLQPFNEAAEISTAGDSFFLVFIKPSDAVRFALQLQARLRALALSQSSSRREEALTSKSEILPQGGTKSEIEPSHLTSAAAALQDRIGIHIGEVVIEETEGSAKPKDLYGVQVDTCARVMSLASADQILLTRSAFDNARQVLKGEELKGLKELQWLNHGTYVLAGLDEPLEVCEVGEVRLAYLKPPTDTLKAQRKVSADDEPVLGWRPAVEQVVPNTKWVLEKQLGEGGFGEVWLGRHQTMKERRVFKFCFRADRARSLKREMTLFRLLKERVGEHPNIVSLREVYFDAPPFYIEMDYVAGSDLKAWCAEQGGVKKVPLATRLEIVAQIADALQAAHDAGVIHRDVKPGNILVSNPKSEIRNPKSEDPQPSTPRLPLGGQVNPQPSAKLTDFGIGQVVSEEFLKGMTRAGFTETIMSDSSTSHTGTQMYMAPELLAGKPASPRSDIYSLGVLLYQLLVSDLTRPLTTDWAENISDPLLRDDLRHCFAGNPNDRFAAAGQLAKNLRALTQRQQALAEQQSELAASLRAAYRRGVIRTTSIAAIIVLALVSLTAVAVKQWRRATERELSARQNQYAADVNLAQQALEDENLGRAMELLKRHRPEPGEKDLRGWEWRYLWQLCQSDEMFSLAGHSNSVQAVAFSPDGSLLASCGFDHKVRLWDVTARRETTVFTHGDDVRSLAFSTDGKILATGSGDGTGKLWDMSTRKEIHSFPQGTYSGAVAFSPDGQMLATGGVNGKISLWDWRNVSLLAALPGHSPKVVGSLAFSPDGWTLASASGWSSDNTIRLWDIETRRERKRLPMKSRSVHSLAFSPDGSLLASGNWDKTVSLWNTATLDPMPSLSRHKAWVSSVAFSPNGRILATASGDQTIKLWEVGTWQEISTLKGHLWEVNALAFSPDGKSLATGSKDGGLKLWSTAAKKTKTTRLALSSDLHSIGFSPDWKAFFTLSHDGTMTLWDAATLRQASKLGVSMSNLTSVALSSARVGLVAAGGQDGSVLLYDVASQRVVASLKGHPGAVYNLAFSPDGKTLATVGDDQVIRLWDVASRQELVRLKQNIKHVGSRLFFSSNGDMLAASHDDLTVTLWDIAKRRELGVLKGHKTQVRSVAFSRDGKSVATAANDGTAKLWNLATLRTLKSFKGQLLGLHMIAFSADGRRLAAGTGEGTIKLWDIATSQEVLTLKGHGHWTGHVFFLDSDTLISSSADDVILWPAASLAEIDAAEKTNSKEH